MLDGQFGPYKLIQQIAVGGMAEIHLAKTKGIAGFEKFVALKMIHPNFSEDQQFIEMLIDEAKLTVQLQHVNIAQTFDLGRVDDTFYITMEFVDGADLYKLLRCGAEMELDVPIEVAGYIAKEVANGLDYAHRKRDIHGRPLGIVHRDVSPQNVLISHSGEVKIVDFGIAKATMRARQTAVGVIKGKYYYMSPEQAWGEKLDPRSDIFSCGILLYEMLTGQMLYLEEDLHKLLGMVRRADIASPTTLRPGIPVRLERIVMRALARKPENRYQSAADLASDLERFLHAHSPIFTPTKVVQWTNTIFGERQPLEAVAPVEPVDATRNTAHISRDELFLDASEFTDHNSVIFDSSELDAVRGAQIQSSPDGIVRIDPGPDEDARTFDLDDEFDEQATVAQGEPIRRREPARPPRSARRSTRPIERDEPDFSEVNDFEDIEERTVVSGPPLMDALLNSLGVAPPAASSADENDQPDHGFNDQPGEDDYARRIDEPTLRADESITAPEARRGALLSRDGFDDATELEELPAQRPASPAEPAPVRADPKPTPSWERSPALAAANPKPAVSAIRPPKRSRRTPPSMPAQPGPSVLSDLLTGPGRVPRVAMGVPVGADPGADAPRPTLQGQAVSGGHQPDPVASSRPVQRGGPGAPASGFPPPAPQRPANDFVGLSQPLRQSGPFPGGNPALMNTSMQIAAVEVDDIPDHYKLRRGVGSKKPWIIGAAVVLALIGAAVAAAVLAKGGDDTSGGEIARIDVVSTPPGGTVTVDGQPVEQKTPTVFRSARQGKTYIVAVELDGYQRWESETMVPVGQDGVKVIAKLERLTVRLTVESDPSDAEVFLNGKSYGRTPLSLPDIDPDVAGELVLKRRNYLPVKRRLDWSIEREKALHFELRK